MQEKRMLELADQLKSLVENVLRCCTMKHTS